MQKKFEDCVKTMLEIIGENPNREGLIKTPNRVFKTYEFLLVVIRKMSKNLNDALFESSNNEMVLVRDIDFIVFANIIFYLFGRAHVAYIPNKK